MWLFDQRLPAGVQVEQRRLRRAGGVRDVRAIPDVKGMLDARQVAGAVVEPVHDEAPRMRLLDQVLDLAHTAGLRSRQRRIDQLGRILAAMDDIRNLAPVSAFVAAREIVPADIAARIRPAMELPHGLARGDLVEAARPVQEPAGLHEAARAVAGIARGGVTPRGVAGAARVVVRPLVLQLLGDGGPESPVGRHGLRVAQELAECDDVAGQAARQRANVGTRKDRALARQLVEEWRAQRARRPGGRVCRPIEREVSFVRRDEVGLAVPALQRVQAQRAGAGIRLADSTRAVRVRNAFPVRIARAATAHEPPVTVRVVVGDDEQDVRAVRPRKGVRLVAAGDGLTAVEGRGRRSGEPAAVRRASRSGPDGETDQRGQQSRARSPASVHRLSPAAVTPLRTARSRKK